MRQTATKPVIASYRVVPVTLDEGGGLSRKNEERRKIT
jgi:hypothetical protein